MRFSRPRRMTGCRAGVAVVAALLLAAPTAEAAYPGNDGMVAWVTNGFQTEVGYGAGDVAGLVAEGAS